MEDNLSSSATEYATLQEARAISFGLLRLTMSEPQEEAEQIREGNYLCFTDSLPEIVEQRFIIPPLDEAVQTTEATEVRLHLKNIAPPQESLASVALQRCVTSVHATALVGVRYDVLSQTEKEGPCLRVSSSLDIFPSEQTPTKLGISAEGLQDKDWGWPAAELPTAEAQLYMALQVARDRAHNPMSHEGLSQVEYAKLTPSPAFSAEAHFLAQLVLQAPQL